MMEEVRNPFRKLDWGAREWKDHVFMKKLAHERMKWNRLYGTEDEISFDVNQESKKVENENPGAEDRKEDKPREVVKRCPLCGRRFDL